MSRFRRTDGAAAPPDGSPGCPESLTVPLVLHETKDLKFVAARLGHTGQFLVLKTYGHLLPGVDVAAADRLDDVLRQDAR